MSGVGPPVDEIPSAHAVSDQDGARVDAAPARSRYRPACASLAVGLLAGQRLGGTQVHRTAARAARALVRAAVRASRAFGRVALEDEVHTRSWSVWGVQQLLLHRGRHVVHHGVGVEEEHPCASRRATRQGSLEFLLGRTHLGELEAIVVIGSTLAGGGAVKRPKV